VKTKKTGGCDLDGGWPECWNTECPWHGKAATKWHDVRRRQAGFGADERKVLREEEKTLYAKLIVEPPRKGAVKADPADHWNAVGTASRGGSPMTLNARERLTITAALKWLVECVRSGKAYDMSHLTFGDDPLSESEIESLCRNLGLDGVAGEHAYSVTFRDFDGGMCVWTYETDDVMERDQVLELWRERQSREDMPEAEDVAVVMRDEQEI
jgi:hypothetical protein